jgi:tellurite resistance protein
MGGVRNGNSLGATAPVDGQQEAETRRAVEEHLRAAADLLRGGSAAKAFGELVRASRALPMSRRMAAALVTYSLKAGTEAAAIMLLSSAANAAEGALRREVRRQLARVLRRVGQRSRGIEALEALLTEAPGDRRARHVLHQLLQREARWEALEASLAREAQEALTVGAPRRAARASLWRARVLEERLGNLGRAAEGYALAADQLAQGEDARGSFSLRLVWLRALRTSGAPEAVLADAVAVCLAAGARVDREAEARQVAEELGLWKAPPALEPAPPPEPPAPLVPVTAAEPRPELSPALESEEEAAPAPVSEQAPVPEPVP